MTQWLDHLGALADRYDGYVIDQFGVLHDGITPYPGAAEALRELRARGKRVIVLSNSGKRAAPNAERLSRFGVTPAHYDALITSGELMFQMLRQRDRAPFDTLGRRVWLGHPAEDGPTLQGLDLEAVEDPAQADFVLLASLPDVAGAAEALHPALDLALDRGLPLICANPDRQRLSARGVEPSSGALAQRHADRGGEVVWLGKPHALIYTVCREALGRWGSRHFLAIGDSLEHDIGGGARAGYDTCFIAGGLHAADFASAAPAEATLARLLDSPPAHGAPAPTWALPTLRWA
ncbi:HAD superfamily hydrolase (TIGR01459 family) [Sphaerotilus hippei]|uniref:HAD superfamily hydrolase (TIGR01459 family) n=1 Tax=Sphaerotilus hippei TaxID=744406 RepID=A0A318H177_9BURK|nr:TIGR01459 family HAD-type hydrolase [Sphaerotilus hippei]PXW96552.1 HAD superfamily hydrolase (TIGR01459 family) [Sphaerotilus hippei]